MDGEALAHLPRRLHARAAGHQFAAAIFDQGVERIPGGLQMKLQAEREAA